jgi:hypothetical protein
MARGKNAAQPLTTAQQLGSLIKSARDIMRKDKGLSTDIDRLPMLTWIMFLKFLDDIEQIEETNAAMRGKRYRPAIEPPYRWRDWAGNEAGITGPELIAFVNQDEAIGPDGRRGMGLFAYLRGLQGGDGATRRRQVIATVFSGVVNRMTSGYLLRDVLNKVNGIHFLAKEELYTLGNLYETMLREMRDAAGRERRILHTAIRGPLHGRDDQPQARRRGARSRLRHRRLSGRSLSAPGEAVPYGRRQVHPPELEPVWRRGEAAALPALADEPALAWARGAGDQPGQQPCGQDHRDRRWRAGWM